MNQNVLEEKRNRTSAGASELEEALASLRFAAEPSVAHLIEKVAPGVHARRYVVQVGVGGFAGDHPRKSWWRGKEVPGRDVTAMTSEALEVLGVDADVPGDNLITQGLDLGQLVAGDRLLIGDVVLRRTEKPHRPCDTFARRTTSAAMRAVAATDTRGALFVVEKPGAIHAGDPIRVVRCGEEIAL